MGAHGRASTTIMRKGGDTLDAVIIRVAGYLIIAVVILHFIERLASLV